MGSMGEIFNFENYFGHFPVLNSYLALNILHVKIKFGGRGQNFLIKRRPL